MKKKFLTACMASLAVCFSACGNMENELIEIIEETSMLEDHIVSTTELPSEEFKMPEYYHADELNLESGIHIYRDTEKDEIFYVTDLLLIYVP